LVVTNSLPVLFALPWILYPVVMGLRARRSRTLEEEPASAAAGAPLVSLVIPARNEAHNITRCVESALAADYPALEIIVVDDHSTDETGAIVRAIAARDARLRIVTPEPLPDGWFGKQWACTAGARVARGSIIGFLDADTVQAPDLVPRVVNTMHARQSDMLSVAGTQEMGSFWERLIQPQVFMMILARYGGTEIVNESPRAIDKIANGQCLFVRREAYDAIGGHALVKDKVAEDLALAQRFFLAGCRTTFVVGTNQLSTRMYTSLRELVEGWGKNFYAGGMDAMPFGRFGAVLYPLLLVGPRLLGVVPPLLVVLGLLGVVSSAVLLWAEIVVGMNLLWWVVVYPVLGVSPVYALLYPLGEAVVGYIALRSVSRGRRVEWKGREYVAG
jgi:chlorobactene glucosyltransferase